MEAPTIRPWGRESSQLSWVESSFICKYMWLHSRKCWILVQCATSLYHQPSLPPLVQTAISFSMITCSLNSLVCCTVCHLTLDFDWLNGIIFSKHLYFSLCMVYPDVFCWCYQRLSLFRLLSVARSVNGLLLWNNVTRMVQSLSDPDVWE